MKTQEEQQKQRQIELKNLYKKWPDIKRYLKSLGCDALNAEDIFQEALVVFLRKKENPAFELTVDSFYYVKSTCRLLWMNETRKLQKIPSQELTDNLAEIEDDWWKKESKIRTIEKAIEKLGQQCQDILQLFYAKNWSMEAIAQKVGLRNDKVVKAQKYRCIQKAKELAEKAFATESDELFT